jgi:hypothetical protein
MFPEAEESVMRLIVPRNGIRVDVEGSKGLEWIDGYEVEVMEWDLQGMEGKDIKFWWDEGDFRYRKLTRCV